ncbi:hypothetical protein GO495_10295 [Chitinophaga oryziterrae]|uniref:Entericidin EcnAB n=1 Tax=Chitinophaga oryziterrae TaxID=1031224 RepID=A0A6N8J6Y8_9BACT|nr:hypothetical protein [Chitinophaga oryziterrae]MVT40970.1 hypothetical protein [Chitinophaga oryziterrae]
MKNFLKIGFLALALGVFVASCGGNGSSEGTDSTANAATEAIDSSKAVADSTVSAVVDSAKATVDSVAKAAADTTKKK